MNMLLYRLRNILERLNNWREGRRAERRMNALLRRHGFAETAHGRWERPI